MAKNQIQFIELTKDQRAECERLSRASASGWWRMSKEEIPSFVPAGLHPKLDGGVFILSGSASGLTFLMYGAERIDYPDNAVDIQPFGAVVSPSGASPTMAVIHHGGWPERSIELPPDYVQVMSGCSAGNYFFARPPEGKTSGPLDDLSDDNDLHSKGLSKLCPPSPVRAASNKRLKPSASLDWGNESFFFSAPQLTRTLLGRS